MQDQKKFILDLRFADFDKKFKETNLVMESRPKGGKDPSSWIDYRKSVQTAINNDLEVINRNQSKLTQKKKKFLK